jgi:hypothetical protein
MFHSAAIPAKKAQMADKTISSRNLGTLERTFFQMFLFEHN